VPIEDYLNLTDADYEDLPPLVAKGEDREKKLAEVVERWATQTADLPRELSSSPYGFESCEQHPATLRRIDLRDDNEDAKPIDLGRDLLKPLADRLASLKVDDRPRVCVALLGCRIRACHAAHLPIDTLVAFASRFDADADFREATFSRDADFREATFRGDADYREATFSGDASFREATFSGDASFREATFSEYAFFREATFSGDASFREATFSGAAYFREATFSGYAVFREATFGGDVDFVGGELRLAKVAASERPLRRWGWGRRVRLACTEWLNWRRVRALGELTALTRVSYLALVVVPLLAGVWGPLRAWIASYNGGLDATGQALSELVERVPVNDVELTSRLQAIIADLTHATLPESMPAGWLLAFLSALGVVVAQLIYQLAAPELIREKSQDDLVDDATAETREHGINNERLARALDHLRSAEEAMPHRHSRWFVKRERRTVWIPDAVDHRFKNLGPEPSDGEANETDEPEKPTPSEDTADDDSTEQQIVAMRSERGRPAGPVQEVDATDRMRIAIEEGEKARYAIEAFRSRWAAWLSGGLYLTAGWLILATILRQFVHIAAASPIHWLGGWAPGWFGTLWGWAVASVAVVMVGLTLFGAWVAEEGTWGAKRFESVVARFARSSLASERS